MLYMYIPPPPKNTTTQCKLPQLLQIKFLKDSSWEASFGQMTKSTAQHDCLFRQVERCLQELSICSSAPGLQNRDPTEGKILLHWSYFLSDAEQGSITVKSGNHEQISILSLEDILAFATGTTSFPVLGFEQQGTLTILHDGGVSDDFHLCVASVFACAQRL